MLAIPAVRAESSSHWNRRLPIPSLRCDGRTASSTRCARSSPNSTIAKPVIAPRPAALLLPSHATTASVSRSRIARSTRGASYFQPRPASMKSRDMSEIAWASRGSARRMVIARGVMARLCHVRASWEPPRDTLERLGYSPHSGSQNRAANKTGENPMDALDRPTIQRSAADLADEIKTRSADAAAAKLQPFGGAEIAAALLRLSPAFAQDVLAALPDETRERTLAAVPDDYARQWQRNAQYDETTVGRMMEPVLAAFAPRRTVGETIESLREMVKSAFITYVYVLDEDEHLLGIVTMRDLLFSDNGKRLSEVMIKDVFALHAAARLQDAMKLVLDRHYPVYPVVDGERHLLGLVRGQAMFEAQAIEISLQAGTMMGIEKEERIGTPWFSSLKMRHPWLQLNLLTASLAAAVVGMFQDTIDRLVILALFLPVLAGQSGNTGCQALAVTLRGMTLGELKPGMERKLVTKEALLGLLNGAGVGIAAGVGMYITATGQHSGFPWLLAFVVFLAMVGACVASGISGAMVPLTLKRFGFDPATASSIFLTTATDVVSMGMLLGLATLLVH